MRKSVLFLMTFVAIAMMSCDPAKYSDPKATEISGFFYRSKTLEGKTTWAVVNRNNSEFIKFSEEYSSITTIFDNRFFMAEKDGKKYLYDDMADPCFDISQKSSAKDQYGNKVVGRVAIYSYSDSNINGENCYSFYPGKRYDLQTEKGLAVLYVYQNPARSDNAYEKKSYGFFQDYFACHLGFVYKENGKLGFFKHAFRESSRGPVLEEVVKPKRILEPVYDELYETYDKAHMTIHLLARQGKNWFVFDMEGNICTRYPNKINSSLPDKARKNSGKISRIASNSDYLYFLGNETMGVIEYDSRTPYQY